MHKQQVYYVLPTRGRRFSSASRGDGRLIISYNNILNDESEERKNNTTEKQLNQSLRDSVDRVKIT